MYFLEQQSSRGIKEHFDGFEIDSVTRLVNASSASEENEVNNTLSDI